MALEATLGSANLLQLAEALYVKAERVSQELEKCIAAGKDAAPAVHSSDTEVEQTFPELSRIAWAASSNVDSARNETRAIYRLPPETLALIIDFCQSEQFERHYWQAYRWVRLMLVSRMWKATILAFPSLWSKLVLNASVSQSGMLALVDRSGSHPLRVAIPPAWSEAHPRSVCYKHVELVIKLLPRVSRLTIDTCNTYDTSRLRRMFQGRSADQLWEFDLNTVPVLKEEFTLHAPRLRFLSLACVESRVCPLSENITHLRLDSNLDIEALESCLKSSPRLEEIWIKWVRRLIGAHSKIYLLPGIRLIITDSHNVVVSLFALGSTNYLSIMIIMVQSGLPTSPFLKLALPRDVSCLRNLDNLTAVHLRLADTGGTPRTITVDLKCSTADRETLHVEFRILRSYSPDPMEMEIVPERPPAMRVLGCLRPLDLGKVAELKMEGFVGEWGIQRFELEHFLRQMPALRRIVTGDDNKAGFSCALGTLGYNVAVEGV